MGVNYLIDTHILLWWLFNDPKKCRVGIAHRPFTAEAKRL
jgi:PIN domain nuclease of toxin-antitoxin system